MIRATSDDVAHQARVSSTAVLLYLHNRPGRSDETRQRNAQTIRKVGYVPRRSRNGVPNLIGLLVEMLPHSIFSETYSELLQGLERQAHQAGYHVVLKPVGPQGNGSIEQSVVDGHMASLIALGGGDLTNNLHPILLKLAELLVLLDNYLLDSPSNSVVPDTDLGASG
jgi:DNA-binding LacI/PurR family transcriptional regulator